jgi:hypothetical protein
MRIDGSKSDSVVVRQLLILSLSTISVDLLTDLLWAMMQIGLSVA